MSITVEWRFLIQYRQRARNSRTFSNGFLPWPLRTEISPVSLNLFTILLTVDGDRPRFFAILRWDTLFFNWQTILSRSSALRGEPRPILAEKGRVVSTVLWRFSLMDQSPPPPPSSFLSSFLPPFFIGSSQTVASVALPPPTEPECGQNVVNTNDVCPVCVFTIILLIILNKSRLLIRNAELKTFSRY